MLKKGSTRATSSFIESIVETVEKGYRWRDRIRCRDSSRDEQQEISLRCTECTARTLYALFSITKTDSRASRFTSGLFRRLDAIEAISLR